MVKRNPWTTGKTIHPTGTFIIPWKVTSRGKKNTFVIILVVIRHIVNIVYLKDSSVKINQASCM